MKTVGVRELKDKLSEYLRRAAAGERVLVTDRGTVVAELVPPGTPTADPAIPPGLLELARQGQLTLGAPRDGTDIYPLLPRPKGLKHTVAELIDETRGDR